MGNPINYLQGKRQDTKTNICCRLVVQIFLVNTIISLVHFGDLKRYSVRVSGIYAIVNPIKKLEVRSDSGGYQLSGIPPNET